MRPGNSSTDIRLKRISDYIERCKADCLRDDIDLLEHDFGNLQKSMSSRQKSSQEKEEIIDGFLETYCIRSLSENKGRRQHSLDFLKKDIADCTFALVICPPFDTKMPSLAIAALMSSLESTREKPAVIDLNILLYNLNEDKGFWDVENIHDQESWEKVGSLYEENREFIGKVLGMVRKSRIDIIGLSLNPSNIVFSILFLRDLKKINPEIKVIVGGTLTFMRELILDENLVDYRLVGDGEVQLMQVIEHIRHPFTHQLPKNAYKPGKHGDKAGEYDKASITDLDKVRYPTYDGFDLSLYEQNILPVYMSRGCIRHCTFCYDWIVSGPGYRTVSPDFFVRSLKRLRDTHRINYFYFNDLLCNGDLVKLREICDLLIKEKLGILWQSYAVIRQDMTGEILDKMRKSGCAFLHYGVESGSDKVLKLMNKGFTADEAAGVIRRTHAAGIRNIVNILIGYPGEEESDFIKTKKFITSNRDAISSIGNVTTCSIMPRTLLQHNAQALGIKTLPGNSNEYTNEWTFRDNNSQARYRRAQEILDLLKEQKIPVGAKFTSLNYRLD